MKRTVCCLFACLALLAVHYGHNAAPTAEKESIREVQLERPVLTNVGFALTLRARERGDRIEMIVGFLEGQSISMAHNKEQAPRPMTHDIFKTFLDRNGWRVDRVIVRDLVNGTFLADLVVNKNGQQQVYDSRPSDAIALALRYGAKIFVADKVFQLQRREDEKVPEKTKARPNIT